MRLQKTLTDPTKATHKWHDENPNDPSFLLAGSGRSPLLYAVTKSRSPSATLLFHVPVIDTLTLHFSSRVLKYWGCLIYSSSIPFPAPQILQFSWHNAFGQSMITHSDVRLRPHIPHRAHSELYALSSSLSERGDAICTRIGNRLAMNS